MKETLCGSVWAYALKSKSVNEDPWIADQLVDDMRTVGLANERILVKPDQEASIVDLQLGIAKRRDSNSKEMELRTVRWGIPTAMVK